jgi:hypothetical protein
MSSLPPKRYKSLCPKRRNKIRKVKAPQTEMTMECQISFSALSISLAPILLAIAELIAPPSAPPDIV